MENGFTFEGLSNKRNAGEFEMMFEKDPLSMVLYGKMGSSRLRPPLAPQTHFQVPSSIQSGAQKRFVTEEENPA